MRALVCATAVTLGLAGAALAPIALAQSAPPVAAAPAPTTFTLSAEGEEQATPDEATITLGVQTTAPTAQQAMRQNADRMSAVMDALKRLGLPDKDVQTSNISLNAQYENHDNAPATLTGYQAANDVTIRVEDLNALGPAIDAVTAAGASQVNGISFGLKDPKAAEDRARLAAVKALEAKAELYAGATGYHITRLVNLSENGGYQPVFSPMPMMAARMKSTPVSAGELTVRIDINGIYELSR